MNPLVHFPAHIITSPSSLHAQEQTIKWLQEIFCEQKGCQRCAVCRAIDEKNFYGFLWITPESGYTLDLIEPILERIQLQLLDNQHYFFILNRADLLTPACSNMLLKSIEEPPVNYHFVFITHSKNSVLPTIISRCIETALTPPDSYLAHAHPLLTQALSSHPDWPTIFKEISQYALNEHDTLRLFETLQSTLTESYKKELKNGMHEKDSVKPLLEECCAILNNPIQPGAAKLLWKKFFMRKGLN